LPSSFLLLSSALQPSSLPTYYDINCHTIAAPGWIVGPIDLNRHAFTELVVVVLTASDWP
jgi:hypothetical protein